MPEWLYKYFGDVIQPLILTKDGSKLAKPATFDTKTYVAASFWVQTPEPVFLLSRHHFDPSILYRPRVSCGCPIFLWILSPAPLAGRFLRKMVLLLLAVSLTLIIHFILCLGHITAVMGASRISMAGASHC